MGPATTVTVCSELDLLVCRWGSFSPKQRGTTLSWRGTLVPGAFSTSEKLYYSSGFKVESGSNVSHCTIYFVYRYPRHRKLISINKIHTGRSNREFNLRHDWNSLLSDRPDLLFRRVSEEFYPPADAFPRYLSMFVKELGLKVKYGVDIGRIRSVPSAAGRSYILTDQHAADYSCR